MYYKSPAQIFSRSSPRARLVLCARLIFTSVHLKYAKNYACSAGYPEDSKEMYQDSKRTCKAIVLLITQSDSLVAVAVAVVVW